MKDHSSIERGYPLLADISGFVPFLTQSEQDQAREIVQELLESTYTAYKDHLLQVSRVRTCGCSACRNAPKLDLKFAVHFGEYIPHEIHTQFDLLGLAPLFIRKRGWKEPVRGVLY